MLIPLYVTSAYTLLRSPLRLSDYIDTAHQEGYTVLALTDDNVLYGAVPFYQRCRQVGIRPIIGMSLQLRGRVLSDRLFHILILACNEAGYQQLVHLSSLKMQQAPEEQLHEYLQNQATDVVVLSGGESDELTALIAYHQQEQALQVARYWQEQLGERWYLAVTPQYKMQRINQTLLDLGMHCGITCVVNYQVHYVRPQDHLSMVLLQAIQANEPIDLEQVVHHGEYYVPSLAALRQQAEQQFPESVIQATEQLIDRLDVQLTMQQKLLPKFAVPDQQSASEYLRALCEEGLRQRGVSDEERYQKRLAHELAVIDQMGFSDYFLIVWDVMRYAHEHHIMTGPGRGSAAGSLVAYTLFITQVDPVAYDLLFERFLNPERYTMPDIDLDFPDNKREEILAYVGLKYGHNHVAQIATFGTFGSKQAIRDVARMMGYTQVELKQLSRALPNQPKSTLLEAYENSAAFRRLIDSSARNQLLYDISLRIEGLPRHVSTHAAGVVISDQPLVQVIPVQQLGSGLLLTQYTMKYVEDIGLLKMDFLGLKNLAILDTALSYVGDSAANIWQLPLADAATLDVFRQARTNGIFQFESRGIRAVLRRVAPNSLEEIAAVNALYRPGPMEQIDRFVRRKNGTEPIDYPDPSLHTILSRTFGVMVYQEQVMQVAAQMAGFSLGEADVMRRAISKKDHQVLDAMRQRFVQKAQQLQHSAAVANKVYDYIVKFGDYGFNRSHAFAYSYLAYQLAYLKAHHPRAFFGGLLTHTPVKHPHFRQYLSEAKQQGIAILGPDINRSQWRFALEQPDGLRFGLGHIQGLRREEISAILQERNNNGPFHSVHDLLQRLDARFLKREFFDALVGSGALDCFGHTRASLLQDGEALLKNAEYQRNEQLTLDGLGRYFVHQIQPLEELPLETRLVQETHYVGYPFSGTPLDRYADLYRQHALTFVADLPEKGTVSVLVQVREQRRVQTKKQERMAFVSVFDVSGDLSMTVFPKLYARVFQLLEPEAILVVTGTVSLGRDGQWQLLAQQVESIASYQDRQQTQAQQRLYVKVLRQQSLSDAVAFLQRKVQQYPGTVQIVVYDEQSGQYQALFGTRGIQIATTVLAEIEIYFGAGQVVLKTQKKHAENKG